MPLTTLAKMPKLVATGCLISTLANPPVVYAMGAACCWALVGALETQALKPKRVLSNTVVKMGFIRLLKGHKPVWH